MAEPIERAILVAAPRKGTNDARDLPEHLDELARLVDTAGAVVVDRLSQMVAAPSPSTLIGEGKVEELRRLVQASEATMVIFDEELTPVQGANLERDLEVRVMDRAEVILDIFSTRARSHEARLQVELAQLQYLLPRLTRMWTHLSRIRGGIGLRGPGETQLETDRRMIRRKIGYLRGKLRGVEQHRRRLRDGRDHLLSIALVGYTNAGKSSILRALTGEHDIVVEDRLFATLDTLTREVDLGEGLRARVTDTVGFIRKLPHHLVASFRATLEEAREADLLLHIIDGSHPGWREQVEVVDGVLEDLELDQLERWHIFNKCDAIAEPHSFAAEATARYPEAMLATTMRTDGLVPLKRAMRDQLRLGVPLVSITLPPPDGARLAELYRVGDVVKRLDEADGVHLHVRLSVQHIERLRQVGVVVRRVEE